LELPVRFSLLGVLNVTDDTGHELGIPAGRQRSLLAALLLRAGRFVSTEELAQAVWDAAPPHGAAVTLRSYIKRLRQRLGPAEADRITTCDHGYLISVGRAELDVHEFARLCREGSEAADAGHWDRACILLGDALALWRGMPLSDVPSELLRSAELPRLNELRLHALELRARAVLQLGRHNGLVCGLQDLTAGHPFRESLHALLMHALYQGGRQAEALAVYQRARQMLIDELGVEPGQELQDMHQRVLSSDPGLLRQDQPDQDLAGMVITPRQLPAAVPHFTGRSSELQLLDHLCGDAAGTGVIIATIVGMGGVGKTALAVHWAHQMAGRFPDGQLYADLRGNDPSHEPLPADQVVRDFLEALGVPRERVPESTEAAAALYRSRLADRRLLVVLDNARDAEHVRPLLPGSATCMALITSRDELASLAVSQGARPISLDVFTEDEARELLVRRLGRQRVASDADAVTRVIALCARLPLALNVVSVRAAARRDSSLAALARRE
jgi:DNA-binding SARP family transcriptional activator